MDDFKIKERKKYANISLYFTGVMFAIVLGLVIANGIFSLFHKEFISAAVLIALIGTLLVSVLSTISIILKYLFHTD